MSRSPREPPMTIGGKDDSPTGSYKRRNGFNTTMTSIIDQAKVTEYQILQRIKNNNQKEESPKKKNGQKIRLVAAAAVDKVQRHTLPI